MSRIIAFQVLSVATPQPDDLQAIAGLVHRVWHQGYGPFLPAAQCAESTPAMFRDLIAQRLPQASIARPGDRIVGYCDHVANCIDGVRVEERYRRRGIGCACSTTSWSACAPRACNRHRPAARPSMPQPSDSSTSGADTCWRKPSNSSPTI